MSEPIDGLVPTAVEIWAGNAGLAHVDCSATPKLPLPMERPSPRRVIRAELADRAQGALNRPIGGRIDRAVAPFGRIVTLSAFRSGTSGRESFDRPVEARIKRRRRCGPGQGARSHPHPALDSAPSGRRNPGIDLNALIQPYLGLIVVGLAVLLVMAFGGLIAQSRRIGLLDRRLRRFTQGASGRSLEGVLEAHLERVQRVTGDVDALMARATVLEADSRRAFSRIGLVRFNPFEDTGGNQSFALALLDSREDGLVVSSLHTRAATRVYAKAISGGKPEAPLSDEEQTAVEQARGEGLGRRALADRVAAERSASDR